LSSITCTVYVNDLISCIQLERQNIELENKVKILEAQNTKLESFQQRYLTLHAAVVDLYSKYLKNLDAMGQKSKMDFDTPDHANSDQIMAAISNILVSFTPTVAGSQYMEFAILANSYWSKYFKSIPELKSKPKAIFATLGHVIDDKEFQIKQLTKQVQIAFEQKKQMAINVDKAVREKNVLETEIKSKMTFKELNETITGGTSSSTPALVEFIAQQKQRPRSAPTAKKRPISAVSTKSATPSARPKPRQRPATATTATARGNKNKTQRDDATGLNSTFLTQSSFV